MTDMPSTKWIPHAALPHDICCNCMCKQAGIAQYKIVMCTIAAQHSCGTAADERLKCLPDGRACCRQPWEELRHRAR